MTASSDISIAAIPLGREIIPNYVDGAIVGERQREAGVTAPPLSRAVTW